MAISLTLKRTFKDVLDYLKSFIPREDTYALGGSKPPSPERDRVDPRDHESHRVLSNPEAFKDLDIGLVMNKVYEFVPRDYEKSEVYDLQYIEEIFHGPVNDPREIAERQAAITELQKNEVLWQQTLAVKLSLDRCLYDERFRSSIDGLKSLQDVGNIVEFVCSIRRMALPASERLKKIKDLGQQFDADARFREAEQFMRELYLPYGLGDIIDDNTNLLRSIGSVGSRREFYSGNRVLLEATQKMFDEEPYKHFINDEARAVDLLKTMTAKLGNWHKELFSFNLSGHDLERWGKDKRKNYSDLMEYWLSLVNEAVHSRVPKLEIGALSRELGFFLGAAALQREWASAVVHVTNPVILDKRERRTEMRRSFNTSLLEKIDRHLIVPNDILSNKDRNLFIITGPNNGGKTTYIRQVGQMYWLAHLGMGLPVDGAEISAIDCLFTSFNTEDNMNEGTGLYLTELKRISQFSRPAAGQPHMTPYSLIFFDEFANGTDHEESVKRTKTVLEYLSQKGVTAYFTTHKHEIADMVERGELPGAVNLAAEVERKDGLIRTTYRIIRNAKENSYGSLQAEAMGITPEALKGQLLDEISRGLYPAEDTRLMLPSKVEK